MKGVLIRNILIHIDVCLALFVSLGCIYITTSIPLLLHIYIFSIPLAAALIEMFSCEEFSVLLIVTVGMGLTLC